MMGPRMAREGEIHVIRSRSSLFDLKLEAHLIGRRIELGRLVVLFSPSLASRVFAPFGDLQCDFRR